MADRYVKNTGNNGNNGSSWPLAFQTVQKGIDDCAASGGGTVHVEHGYYAENLTMRSGVILKGHGPQPSAPPVEAPNLHEGTEICPGKPILDGSNNATVVTFAGLQHAAIENFNIIRGVGSTNNRGGGLYISGSQIGVTSCCILENSSSDFGGGVCVNSGSSNVSFSDDFFWHNASDGGGGMAIIESKTINLANCLFLQNTNSSAQGKGGGAIHIQKSKDVMIQDVEFTSNQSDDLGGGVLVQECSMAIPAVTVQNCRFNGNQSKISGGGIMVKAQSFIAVSDVEFVNNQAKTDGGGLGFNNIGLPGGGEFNPSAVRTAGQMSRITNCSFASNSAGDDGGGLYLTAATMVVVTDCDFRGNKAHSNGGGLHCTFGSAVDIDNCSFEFNMARTGNGGGLSLRNADLSANDVSFIHNVARRGQGGAVFAHTEGGFRWALFLRIWGFKARGGAKIVIENANLDENFARSGGGGFAVRGATYPIAARIKDCSFKNNRVQNAGFGGGIYVQNVSTTLTNNDFDRNQVFLPGNNSRGGGVAGVSCPSFAMTGGTVRHNRANYGGGVALKNCANPTVSGITFNQNFINMPPGAGVDIHAESCAGVTVAGLLNANPGSVPGRVVVKP